MQNTTDAYKTAIRKHDRPYDEVYGTVTFADSTGLDPLTLSPSNIVADSVNWARQCITNDELEFGGVFEGIMDLSIITDMSRYVFYGARLELDYRINVSVTDTPSYEVVHIGKFTIADAIRDDKILKITAYDDMSNLNPKLGSTVLSGKPWAILSQISNITNYPLAFDEAYITANFVNVNTDMQLDTANSGITTYREAVKAVCQNLGCFAQDDRTGKMELRKFSDTPCCGLTKSDYYSADIKDYECKYIALYVTGMLGTFSAAIADEGVIGNIMEITDAPAWDYGVFATLQNQTNDLFNYLKTIVYTPVELEMPSDVSLDCGDRVVIGNDVEMVVTSYEWKWHGGMTLVSSGVNPNLQGTSSDDVRTSRLISRINEDTKIYFWNFTNPETVNVTDGSAKQRIGRLMFSTAVDTDAMFQSTILVNVDTEDVCRAIITYELNGNVFDYQAIEDMQDGKHIISLNYPLVELDGGEQNEFRIYMSCTGGTITIPEQTMKATIWGQGLHELYTWNNRLELEDTITPPFMHFDIVAIDDTDLTRTFITPVLGDTTFTDTMQLISVGVSVVPIADDTDPLDGMSWIKDQFYIGVGSEGDTQYILGTENDEPIVT